MNAGGKSLAAIVQELQLLKHSLLPDERMVLLSPGIRASLWEDAIDTLTGLDECIKELSEIVTGADSLMTMAFKLENSRGLWFEAITHVGADDSSATEVYDWYEIMVKGENLGREDQARLQSVVRDRRREVEESGSEYPMYQLLSEHVLPLLHEELETPAASSEPVQAQLAALTAHEHDPPYHALLTSHHLKSPNKRRSMAHWATQLRLSGFAKVGHPGVMYAAGARADVEEFVANVKAMQWLALRVRFVEALPEALPEVLRSFGADERRWAEFEKVGDVVEEMRRLGREAFVVDMGIGSAGIAK